MMSNTKMNIAPDASDWYEIIRVQFDTNIYGILPIYISASPEYKPIVVYVSSFLDPFEDMMRWLEQIADKDLPASWLLKGERPKEPLHFIYTRLLSNDRVDFRVTYGVKPDENSPCVLHAIVRRKQLVRQFVRAFRKYIKTEYRPEHWRIDVDLREFDFSGIMLKLNKKG